MVKLTEIHFACLPCVDPAGMCERFAGLTSMMVAGIMNVPYWIYNLKIRWELPLLRLWMLLREI